MTIDVAPVRRISRTQRQRARDDRPIGCLGGREVPAFHFDLVFTVN